MNFSDFFVSRPRFAVVLSIIIFVAGLIALPILPIGEYPEVVPPTVVVRTSFAGADTSVIADTVAAPLEQSINGVEGMLYQSSQSTPDGAMALTVTFALGTDPDKDQTLVQNRVAQVLSKLPQEVQRVGVTTAKASPTLAELVNLTSEHARPARTRAAVRRHHHPRRPQRRDQPPARRGPHRARLRQLCAARLAGQQAGHRAARLPAPRHQRPEDGGQRQGDDGQPRQGFPPTDPLSHRLRPHRLRSLTPHPVVHPP